ncbi:MAG: aldehyde dehydrogenase family protein, partial [Candidatus Dormibacteraeota bacterium]|nr:aldehyde dehydrogenase family protein [Candidatus Dormibacteraeota bacterium]
MSDATTLRSADVRARVRPVAHFIAGRFQPGHAGRTFETLDPTTNEPITEVAEGGGEDVDLAVGAARRAFDEGPWPGMPAGERAALLRRIAELIEGADQEISELE